MALTVADDEVLEGIKVLWDATSSLGGEYGPLQSGRLASPQEETGYVMAKSDKGKDAIFDIPIARGDPYQDFRMVTFTGFGPRARMATLGRALLAQFAWLPRDGRTLNFPAPTSLVAIRSLSDPGLMQDEKKKSGKDVWQCVWEIDVQTDRILP